MKKIKLLLLLACGLAFQLHAQDLPVRGKVTDAEGKPLAGATVNIKHTNVSSVTDALGNFQISTAAQSKPVLVVSYVGYSGEELPVKAGSFFSVQLKQVSQALNDVVVVGYGEQRKRDVTGAI